MATGENENIIPINIEEEMRGAYIDYSMSVIVSRALPDVRDGLKPVHRRVLYGMWELGLNYNRPYKKSARIVGEVLGKYHPHGDSSVYDAMVRMAQTWSLRYPLVDGQGNFGSLDGDSPAAMRYTEARLQRIAEEMLVDIDKETVDYEYNFDDTLQEPTVLPAKIPQLLLNGTSGIAVGMATNLAPHNIHEVCDGIIAFIDNREITITELLQHIKGPDFPTAAVIYGMQGIKNAYESGRGRIVIRATGRTETTKTGKEQLIFEDVPFLTNKATLIEKCAHLVNEKKIEGISAIRDESDRKGIRMVFDLRKDAIPSIVMNQLYKYSPLQTSFSVNNVALSKGRPLTMNLKDQIHFYVEHRHEVVIRRTEYDLRKAEERAHILEGLLIALDNLDEVIQTIRESKDRNTAKTNLMERFELSERQAEAIVDMRLGQLANMEQLKIREEYEEIQKKIAYYKEILASGEMRMNIIKDELREMKEKYGDERRTQITMASDDISIEDMIPDENMVLTISHQGYIKRTPLTEYRTQGRGGVGARGVSTKDDDWPSSVFIASSHQYLLFFTEMGKVYWLKVYGVPEGSKTSRGRAIQNLIQIDKEDRVMTIISVGDLSDEDYINNHSLLFCTKKGVIKKTLLEQYSRPRQNGINAISIKEGDALLEVRLTDGNSEIMMGKKSGKVIRFHEKDVRPMGRTAAGVRGVTLESDKDEVVGMVSIYEGVEEGTLMVVSEKGFGKRSYVNEYRMTKRGSKGVKTMNLSHTTGDLVAVKLVDEKDDIMIVNRSGITIRLAAEHIRVMGRATQGVRLLKLNKNDEIASVAKIEYDEEAAKAEAEDQENQESSDGQKPAEDPEKTNDNEQEENNDTDHE